MKLSLGEIDRTIAREFLMEDSPSNKSKFSKKIARKNYNELDLQLRTSLRHRYRNSRIK